MPIEVRRFGVGFRRPDGPPGTRGIGGAVVHSDARGVIAELAFSRGGRIEPHENPNTTWLCVIEGGGWVLVGEDQRRVAAGEAVLWPAGVVHAAWTDQAEMRAIVVEFAGPDDAHVRGILDGRARALGPGEVDPSARAEGSLAAPDRPVTRDRSSGEPV